jgi:glutamate synthase (NADPH) large chain
MEAHRNYLYGLLQEFVDETGSAWGRAILEDFADYEGRFWLVTPKATDLESLLETLRQAA